MESIYFIVPIAEFSAKRDEYLARGFENRGAVRFSLDGSQVLLEESIDFFTEEELAREDILKFNKEAVRQYLVDNKEDWEQDEPDYLT